MLHGCCITGAEWTAQIERTIAVYVLAGRRAVGEVLNGVDACLGARSVALRAAGQPIQRQRGGVCEGRLHRRSTFGSIPGVTCEGLNVLVCLCTHAADTHPCSKGTGLMQMQGIRSRPAKRISVLSSRAVCSLPEQLP